MIETEGTVWKFKDNVDTDAIVPGQYLDASIEEIIPHVFESIEPRFAKEVKSGDIIVAGKNFGCGSSRENAPSALKAMGIGCIVAESFARIFFRNAVAIGLPIISSRDASNSFDEHNKASVNLNKALIENITKRSVINANPLSEEMLEIIEKGGIMKLLKEMEDSKE